jgi:acyl-CoA oxidase
MTDIHDLTKDEIRERTMEKFASMVYYVTNESLDVFSLRMQVSLGYTAWSTWSWFDRY